jgi:hypothetical protein
MTRLLRRDIGKLAVWPDRDSMRLGDRYGANDVFGRGVDNRDPVVAIHRDEEKLAVRRQRDAVRLLADLDRLGDAVARRVDDIERRGPVARDIDRTAILADRHAVRTSGDRNGGHNASGGGIDRADRVVGKVADIDFCAA